MEIFQEPFIYYASLAGLLSGTLCAFLGVYIVWKRIVFLGVTLSQVSALGVALGLFLGWQPVLTAFLLTLFTALAFSFYGKETSVSKESLIGLVYVFAAALSILLIAKNPMAESMGINIISGNILYTTGSDLWLIGGVCIVILPMCILFFKELLFVSFDKETASSMGLSTKLYELFFYISIGLATSVAMRVSGILFVFASLLIPAVSSLLLFRKTTLIFIGAVITVVVAVPLGILLSFYQDIPTGPSIVCVYVGLFLLSWVIRGVRCGLSSVE